jgi:hypothetical protein
VIVNLRVISSHDSPSGFLGVILYFLQPNGAPKEKAISVAWLGKYFSLAGARDIFQKHNVAAGTALLFDLIVEVLDFFQYTVSLIAVLVHLWNERTALVLPPSIKRLFDFFF